MCSLCWLVTEITVSTVTGCVQAASGAGAAAMEELRQQTQDVVSGKPAEPKIFPVQVGISLLHTPSRRSARPVQPNDKWQMEISEAPSCLLFSVPCMLLFLWSYGHFCLGVAGDTSTSASVQGSADAEGHHEPRERAISSCGLLSLLHTQETLLSSLMSHLGYYVIILQ